LWFIAGTGKGALACSAPVAVVPAPPPKPTEPPKPVIPDTAAGKTMTAWLDAFNSGDAARMKAFVEQYKDPEGDMIVAFREQTGGFDLVAVEKSEPLYVTFVVKEKASPMQAFGWLRVKDGAPGVIDSFTLLAIPPGMTAADMRLDIDAETPKRIVDAIARQLADVYVYPTLAKKMTQTLRQHLDHGDYKAITTGPALAAALPTDVKRLDDHFLIGVPIERPINPVTKTDWEGKGIQPDVKVPAADAFEKAKQLAADALAKKHPAAK
jgi:hypothetical protein